MARQHYSSCLRSWHPTARTAVAWAEGALGCREYAGWCLDFMEDALEVPNEIEIIGGDCARESCEMYLDAARAGVPPRGRLPLTRSRNPNIMEAIACAP